MLSFIRHHRLAVALSALAAVTGLAALAIGYFGVHTLFIDDTVSEAAPTFEAVPVETADGSSTSGTELPSPRPTESSDATAGQPIDAEAGEPGDPIATEDGPAVTAPPDPPTPEVVVEYRGSFVSGDHPTSGTAVVLGNGTGQRFLRFEDFETDNGPDLNVYLVNSSTGDVSDYVDLGDLTGNIGDQNYEIPRDVDLATYDRVVIWCVRFGVDFGSADLA